MGWMPGCPQDPGVYHGALSPIAIVLHRTYGAWGGDYSVGKQGIFHFLVGKDDGHWAQFAPTEVVQYHCNGANFKAVGIEIEGTNEDPLTPWQLARLGDLLHWLHSEHAIPLDYLAPASVPPASVHVNDGNFRGVISHVSVMTDDGSQQHTDLITVETFNAAVGATPAPPPPAPPIPTSQEDLMLPIVILDGPQKGVYVPFGKKLVKLPNVNSIKGDGRSIVVTGQEFDGGFGDAVKAALAG